MKNFEGIAIRIKLVKKKKKKNTYRSYDSDKKATEIIIFILLLADISCANRTLLANHCIVSYIMHL